jgi:hypothetical protein
MAMSIDDFSGFSGVLSVEVEDLVVVKLRNTDMYAEVILYIAVSYAANGLYGACTIIGTFFENGQPSSVSGSGNSKEESVKSILMRIERKQRSGKVIAGRANLVSE